MDVRSEQSRGWRHATASYVVSIVHETTCEHCGQQFHYLATEERQAKASGLESEGKDIIEAKAVKKAKDEMAALNEQTILGLASCPGCGQYQSWMIKQVTRKARLRGLLMGIGTGLFVSVVYIGAMASRGGIQQKHLLIALAILLFSVFDVFMLGAIFKKSKLPEPSKDDPRNMTDEQFDTFSKECEANGILPADAWQRKLDD